MLEEAVVEKSWSLCVEQAGGADLSDAVSWDAASLTATVELGVVVASQGASLQLSWAESPRSELLCRSGAQHITLICFQLHFSRLSRACLGMSFLGHFLHFLSLFWSLFS